VPQKPLELILARDLMSAISTPAFLAVECSAFPAAAVSAAAGAARPNGAAPDGAAA
jgi:hypothetical protein